MPSPVRLIVVLGATTTGKTRLSHQLARQLGGELINADKFYLFDGPAIGTGRADIAEHPDVAHHLYGIVPVRGPKPSVSAWTRALQRTIADIHRRGRVAIVEGSSFGLASAAARIARSRADGLVLGVDWKPSAALAKKVHARVEEAWSAGLVEETDAALAAGLGDCWVMRRSVVYPDVVAHLRGKQSHEAAQQRIVAGVLAAARVQHRQFQGVSGVRWLPSASLPAAGAVAPDLALA